MLAKWTISDQFHRLQLLEVTLSDKLVPGLDLDIFVGSDREEEEEEEGFMPYLSNVPKSWSKQ
jgi:hypothetical protein